MPIKYISILPRGQRHTFCKNLDRGEMLTPTHVQVIVLRTKDLLTKGINDTNDVFIIFGLGKEKYQSSLKDKASEPLLEWNEKCDLPIPSSDGNKAEVKLKIFHKGSLGDKFLGRVALPLADFEVTHKPRPKWYLLKPKSGKEKDIRNRGEIQVQISFLFKTTTGSGSLNNLASQAKQKNSLRSSLGSLLNLGNKKKNKGKKKDGHIRTSTEVLCSPDSLSLRYGINSSLGHYNNDDPGVISEEDNESIVLRFDENKNVSQSPPSASSMPTEDKASLIQVLPLPDEYGVTSNSGNENIIRRPLAGLQNPDLVLDPHTKFRELVIKIAVLGDSGVGKTSLVKSFATGKRFLTSAATSGADLLKRDLVVDFDKVRLTMWDVPGQMDKFQAILPQCLREVHGVIFCYDPMHHKSLVNVYTIWKQFATRHIRNENYVSVLVACKNDLASCQCKPKGSFCRPVAPTEQAVAVQFMGSESFSTSSICSDDVTLSAPFQSIIRKVVQCDSLMSDILHGGTIGTVGLQSNVSRQNGKRCLC